MPTWRRWTCPGPSASSRRCALCTLRCAAPVQAACAVQVVGMPAALRPRLRAVRGPPPQPRARAARPTPSHGSPHPALLPRSHSSGLALRRLFRQHLPPGGGAGDHGAAPVRRVGDRDAGRPRGDAGPAGRRPRPRQPALQVWAAGAGVLGCWAVGCVCGGEGGGGGGGRGEQSARTVKRTHRTLQHHGPSAAASSLPTFLSARLLASLVLRPPAPLPPVPVCDAAPTPTSAASLTWR